MGVLIIQFKGRVFDRPLTRTKIIQFEIIHELGPYDLRSAQYHSSHALDNGGKPAHGFCPNDENSSKPDGLPDL